MLCFTNGLNGGILKSHPTGDRGTESQRVSDLQPCLSHARQQDCQTRIILTIGEQNMRWYYYLAYFFGGAFLANTLPHFVSGISGHPFQSPFASPPGVGLSSATINVLWGFFNLIIAYLLICRVGSFNLRKTQHVLVLGTGILIMSLMLAYAFGRFCGG